MFALAVSKRAGSPPTSQPSISPVECRRCSLGGTPRQHMLPAGLVQGAFISDTCPVLQCKDHGGARSMYHRSYTCPWIMSVLYIAAIIDDMLRKTSFFCLHESVFRMLPHPFSLNRLVTWTSVANMKDMDLNNAPRRKTT